MNITTALTRLAKQVLPNSESTPPPKAKGPIKVIGEVFETTEWVCPKCNTHNQNEGRVTESICTNCETEVQLSII